MPTIRTYIFVSAAALLAVCAVYSNHFQNEFHFDDAHTIQNNLYIRDLRNVRLFFKEPATFSSLPTNQSYRPLLTTTLAVDYRLGGGLNPLAFHITSFTLFLAQCVALLFLYLRLMDASRPHAVNRWLALFAATWYALHAAIAETVNYIIARSDIMSSLFTVVAVLMYSSRGRARRWHLYLIPAIAAVLSKEQGAMVAPILFAYTALFERKVSLRELVAPRTFLATLRPTLPAFILCTSILLLGMSWSTNFNPGGSRWPYLITQPYVLLLYVLAFIAPIHLTADTDLAPLTTMLDWRFFAGLLFIAGSAVLVVVTAQRAVTRPIAFGILWFFLALLPSSSVIPLAEVMNDHRMYYPFVGLVLSATWAIGLIAAPVRPWHPALRTYGLVAAAIFLLAAHAAGTFQRNIVWRSEESLWKDVTEKSPRNGRGLMNYGVIKMGQGDYATAESYFTRALAFTPQYAYLHINLGVLHAASGRREEAEQFFLNARSFDARNPEACYHYAKWLASWGRVDEAAVLAERAIELSPGHADARQLLASLAARNGRDYQRNVNPTVPRQ